MANRESRTSSNIKRDNEGYRYRRRSLGATSYWSCTADGENSCPARLTVTNGLINVTRNHSHPPPTRKNLSEDFKDNLWIEVVSSEDNPRIIYDRVALEHPLPASIVTFASVERSMARWRHGNRPPNPSTLREYGELINLNEWRKYREYGGGRMVVESIVVNPSTSVTIFGDPDILASLHDVVELFTDATFQVCPKTARIYQFLTIMGRIDDTPISLAWALMTRKTTAAYVAVFRYFRDQLAPHIQPTLIHEDFEPALRNAIVQIYPAITIVHCYFHHTQNIFKKLKAHRKIAGVKLLEKWDLASAFYRKLLGIALLPANDIVTAFEWLKNNTPPNISRFFVQVIAYYDEQWIRSVTPAGFSMYRVNDRTNNHLEAYHRMLRPRFGSHPGIWAFTAKLKNLIALTRTEIASLNQGIGVRRLAPHRNEVRETILNRMWDLLEEGTMSVERFLACYNHVSPAFRNDLLISTPTDVDQFLMLPSHKTGEQPANNGEGVIIIEDRMNEIPLPIVRRDPAEENFQIFILDDLQQSMCPLCEQSILNVVALPCHHWFLCEHCTATQAQQAFTDQAQIICGICFSQCLLFKTIQIS